MPLVRCRNFDQVTGAPLRSGHGCLDSHCRYVHPDSPRWRDAPPSNNSRRVRRSPPRRRSGSISSADSNRVPRRSQQSWQPSSSRYGAEHRELGSRLSGANTTSLGARITPSPAETPTLSERLRDPLPQSYESSLSARLSEPRREPSPPANPMAATTSSGWASKWGSGPAKHVSSSSWGTPADEEISWFDAGTKPAVTLPSRPQGQILPAASRKPSLNVITQSTMQSDDLRPSPSALPSSTGKPSPTLIRKPSTTSAVQSRPPPPPHLPPPPLPPPSRQPPSPAVPKSASGPVSASPAQKTPTFPVPTTPRSSTQAPRSTDQPSVEVTERKIVQMETLCEAMMRTSEYKKALQDFQRTKTHRSNFKSHRITEDCQTKVESEIQEAEVKYKGERSKYEEALLKVCSAWPTGVSKDSRLEDANRQLQALKQQIKELGEKVKSEDTLQKDIVRMDQITARQDVLFERLDQIEEYQRDIENSVQERLDDLAHKHKESFNDLFSGALMEADQMAADAKRFMGRLDQLTQGHDALAKEIGDIHTRQADILRISQKAQEEREELKERLIEYEKRDARLHTELQAVVQALDMQKQQSSNMQACMDQLLDSMKSVVLAQARQHIEERFNVAKQEIGLHMKRTQDVSTKDFKAKYGPVISLLDQFRNSIRSAMDDADHDATLSTLS